MIVDVMIILLIVNRVIVDLVTSSHNDDAESDVHDELLRRRKIETERRAKRED